MAYCTECGTELLKDGTCPKCSTNEEAIAEEDNVIEKAVDKFTNTEDNTDNFAKKDINSNGIYAVLAYFGVLIIVPLVCAPESKFARFHSNQSLVLIIFTFIFTVIASILSALAFSSSVPLGIFITGLLSLISIIPFVMWIQGIANAASGKAKKLPLIGKITILD